MTVDEFVARLRTQMAHARAASECLATPEEQGGYDQAQADIVAWLDAGTPEPPWDG